MILVCGRYEGFDERIVHEFDLQLSRRLRSYRREIAAMTVVDAVSRMIPEPWVLWSRLNKILFTKDFSTARNTRPSNWQGLVVPEVLLNGNHSHINKFRHSRSMLATAVNRPDVFAAI